MLKELKEYIRLVVLEETDRIKSFYGSNFQYTMRKYIVDEGGLAAFGVHFSDNENIAIFPKTRYYPKGVYFYYLTKTCVAGIGHGFATDRKWANVVKINNDRMVIIKPGHPRDFSQADLERCLSLLRSKYGTLPEFEIEMPLTPFRFLDRTLARLESEGNGSYNKLLHDVGYDGIIDYPGYILPIESCQGVMTWPGGLDLVQSVPTNPSKNPTGETKRLEKMMVGLSRRPNGSLKLTQEDIVQVVKMLPQFYHRWDISDSISDLYGVLMQKLDFRFADAWKWVEWKELGMRFYQELESNPTTPKSFWEPLVHASDPGLRATARDMLKQP